MVNHPGKYTGHGQQPPTITPPSVPPSTPYVLTGPFTLSRGGILYFTSGPGITQDGVGLLRNYGRIYVIPKTSGADATGIVDQMENPTPHAFVNGRRGILSVSAFGGGNAYGYDCGCNPVAIRNAGLIQAVSLGGNAIGATDYGCYSGPKFTNMSTGLVAVWASNTGVGLQYGQSGFAFSNAGLVHVTAGTAIGVIGANAFDNSGTIVARDLKQDGGSIGVEIDNATTIYGGTGIFNNTGVIRADTAFRFGGYSGNITISNSGQVAGAVDLSANGDDSTVDNSGSIAGKVSFGAGDNVYDGAAGTQTGGIYVGSGVNTINLGNDSESVFCAQTGGSDTITGGTGDDFIQLFAGNNTIVGGGGVDTVSFAGAANSANVNLATGVAKCNGTDHLSQITRVIGATAFNNTLIAGAAGAELVAGNAQDKLIGGAGNDTLVAGLGGDMATGGGGANAFVYSTGDHTLTITDYRQNGDDDALKIYGYASARSITQVGADTIIRLSKTDSVDLQNTSAATLDLSSIQFFPASQSPSPGAPPLAPDQHAPAIVTAATATAAPHAFISAISAFWRPTASISPSSGEVQHRAFAPLVARP